MAAANKLRPIVLSRFVLNVICPLVGWFSYRSLINCHKRSFFLPKKRMDTDSSTPKVETAAKKMVSGIINCDLYFSPTGIKNVLISSKIIKKKTSADFRI